MAKKIDLNLNAREERDDHGRKTGGGVAVPSSAAATRKPTALDDPMSLESRVKKLSKTSKIAAGVAAAGLAFGLYTGVSSSAELSKMHDGMTNVVVAAQTINAGETISEDSVEVKEVPAEYVSSGALSDSSAFVGEVATTRIDEGTQLSDSLISASRNTASLSNATTKGKKSVTISVDDAQGFAGLLKIGDHIDVLGKNNKTLTRITSDATVIALGSSLSDTSESYTSVTVEVTAKEADSIRAAQANNGVSLELHSKADSNKKEQSASNQDSE